MDGGSREFQDHTRSLSDIFLFVRCDMVMATADVCSVRLARSEDLDQLCECWWMLVEEQNAFDLRAIPTEENRRRARNFLRDRILRGWMFVASRDSDVIIGIGTMSRDEFFLSGGPDIWNVADIWVRPEHRREGIASHLMAHIEKEAARRGATKLRLSVYAENVAANELYDDIEYTPLMHTLEKSLQEFSS